MSAGRLEAALSGPAAADLLAAVDALLRRFVILPSAASYLALSLFVLHTWAFDAAYATPYIVIESPEKQSGKTRLLEVLELVCRDPRKVASITAAALFQTVAHGRPTLLIDEADAIFAGNGDHNEDLRGVLNAGNVPGSPVIRGGRNGEPLSYEVFCPKVIAGIATGKLPDTIRDRAIVIRIDRKLKSERVERLRRRLLRDALNLLRDGLGAWAGRHQDTLAAYELPAPLEQISDRLEEAWEPLFAIADLAGGQYPAAARSAAHALAGGGDDGATTSHTLLVALRDVFRAEEKLSSAAIVFALNANDELPFGAWNDGQGMRPAEMARLLKPYRLGPKKIRIGSTTLQGYKREWFDAAWARYAPSARTIGTSQQPSRFSASDEPEHNTERSASESREKPHPAWDVPGVPEKPGHKHEGADTSDDAARAEDFLARHVDRLEPLP